MIHPPRHLAALVALLSAAPVWSAPTPIAVLGGEAGAAYAEVVAAMRAELAGTTVAWTSLADAEELGRAPRQRAVVAVGYQACESAYRAGTPTALLCTFLPQAAFDAIVGAQKRQAPVALQPIDHSLARQLDLVRLALPDRKRVGLLLGPQTRRLAGEFATAAAQRGLQARSLEVAEASELSLALRRLLADIDVLVAVPDSSVFNGTTIQNILRTATSHRVAVIGFSPAYVNAGAVLSLYSTPAMIGGQTGKLLRQALNSGVWPARRDPGDFEIGINRAVAHALDIELPADLKQRLREMEETP